MNQTRKASWTRYAGGLHATLNGKEFYVIKTETGEYSVYEGGPDWSPTGSWWETYRTQREAKAGALRFSRSKG